MRIFDGHLDLAMNAVAYNRDLTRSLAELRAYEKDLRSPRDARNVSDGRGTATVTLDALRQGQVRCCTATLFTRARPGATAGDGFLRCNDDSSSPMIAAALAHAQLAYYQQLQRQGYLRLIHQRDDLTPAQSQKDDTLSCVLLVECADMISNEAELQHWFRQGVRAVGLTHIPQGRCGFGNATDGPLSELGVLLLGAMRELGMVLDVSHLADMGMSQAFDLFDGPTMASHSNCRALVPGMRQISDSQIKTITGRGGVVGIVLSAAMLSSIVKRETHTREQVTLAHVAQHIDHVCQLVGDAQHVGIGSDLDGGFGAEYVPLEIESIADLHRIGDALAQRGYKDADIANVMHDNWWRFWQRVLPGNNSK